MKFTCAAKEWTEGVERNEDDDDDDDEVREDRVEEVTTRRL